MSREGNSPKRAVRIDVIESRMERQNISRSALAKRAGLSPKQVNNILDGITAEPRRKR